MLEIVRNHRRLMLFVLLLLVFPSFVFFGMESYSSFMNNANDAAKVEGRVITNTDVDNAMRVQSEQMRQALGASYDPRQFENAETRRAILDGMIQERLIANEATRLHLTVSDAHLQEAIMAIPAIAQLRGADGKFDVDGYRQLLGAQGMTPEQFDARMRFDLSTQQLVRSIAATDIIPASLIDRLIAIRDQQRVVQAITYKPADYAARVTPDEAALKAYYDGHAAEFAVPAQAKVEYLVLSADSFAQGVTVTPEELQSYYEQNKKRFQTAEERQASHILIVSPKDAPAADRAAAKEKAAKLLAEVRANPASFAEVARKNSQDPGSAEKGGELGTFGRGAMVKPFEDAVFALKKDEISDLVETDFGYHIIRVTGIKPSETRPLDAVRAELEKEIRTQKATKQYGEAVDQFTNTVYDRSESLKPAADRLKLTIQTAAGVTRQPNPALGQSPVNNEKVLAAIFSDDVLKNKRNTEAIQVGPNTLVAARVVDYQPATTRKLEEVKDELRAKVVAQQAAALARKAGEARLAALKQAPADDGFGPSLTVSRSQAGDLPGAALEAVMRADSSKLPAFIGVDLGANGYAVLRINKVEEGAKPDAARRQADLRQLEQIAGQSQFDAYYQNLKSRSKVEIIRPAATPAEG